MREYELTKKLLTAEHINVPERKELEGGKVKLSVVRAILTKEVEAHGVFPGSIAIADNNFGEAIELTKTSTGTYSVNICTEVGLNRYQVFRKTFSSFDEAFEAWVRKKFSTSNSLDGVPIDLSA